MAVRRATARSGGRGGGRSGGGGAGQAVTVIVIVALLGGLAWFGWDRMKKFNAPKPVPTGPRVTLTNWASHYELTGNIPDPLPTPWVFRLESARKLRSVGQETPIPFFWVDIVFESGRFTGVQVAKYRQADIAAPVDLLAEPEFSEDQGPELRKLIGQLGSKGPKGTVDGQAGDFEFFGWRDDDGKGLRKSLVCAVRKGAPEASRMIAKARAEWAAGTAGGTATEVNRTKFDVVLLEVGKNRDAVLAAVCEIAGMDPAAGATLVDSAPKPVKLGVSKDEAEAIRKKLEAAGAKAEVK